MLWKTCELNCEKTCELFNFTCFLTCFSHLFHRVWNCWDPVKRTVFTGSEPMQNPLKPCEFLPGEKTCERPCEKPVKNLWTFTVFFTGQGRKHQNLACEQGIFHRQWLTFSTSFTGYDQLTGCQSHCQQQSYSGQNYHVDDHITINF